MHYIVKFSTEVFERLDNSPEARIISCGFNNAIILALSGFWRTISSEQNLLSTYEKN